AHEVCKRYELTCLSQEKKILENETSTQPPAREVGLSGFVGTGEIRIINFEALDRVGAPQDVLDVGRPYVFRLALDSKIANPDAVVSIQLYSEDARVALASANYSYINEAGAEDGTQIGINPGLNFVEMRVAHLLLGAGRYFVVAGVAPHKNTNTYQDFYDLKWKKWVVVVRRKGLTQNVVFEQPVRWSA